MFADAKSQWADKLNFTEDNLEKDEKEKLRYKSKEIIQIDHRFKTLSQKKFETDKSDKTDKANKAKDPDAEQRFDVSVEHRFDILKESKEITALEMCVGIDLLNSLNLKLKYIQLYDEFGGKEDKDITEKRFYLKLNLLKMIDQANLEQLIKIEDALELHSKTNNLRFFSHSRSWIKNPFKHSKNWQFVFTVLLRKKAKFLAEENAKMENEKAELMKKASGGTGATVSAAASPVTLADNKVVRVTPFKK